MKRRMVGMAVVLSLAVLILVPQVLAESYVHEKTVGAAVNWGNGKAYFFKDGKYMRYTVRPDMDDEIVGDKPDPGYPKAVNQETWPGLPWTDFDAVLNWGGGIACFFKGGEFVRYDMRKDRAEPNKPMKINEQSWPGLVWTDGIDAAVNWGNGKIYFFKGGEYIRYDIQKNRADHGYPKPINPHTWPGLIWTDGIDDVVNWGNGKVYFFRGNEYIRYDIVEDRADPGYPKEINKQTWPGLKW
ncbi:MAG: hemopexin repeat-containing protein [Syntrophales bacterium]|nr:hemopexin repeat-containing protein [Syntrophales bacterium]